MHEEEQIWSFSKKEWVAAGILIAIPTHRDDELHVAVVMTEFIIWVLLAFAATIFFFGIMAGSDLDGVDKNLHWVLKFVLMSAIITITYQFMSFLAFGNGWFVFFVLLFLSLILGSIQHNRQTTIC
ncbi:MAG: hypothetical protein IH840_00695 [Candidatus Heimdallarchaeota archaeon]|nr:hypothetical protein [Candidatus Heimdallarchaeota archaeon]